MSFKQLDRWFRSVGCVPAERLHLPPELAGRKGYYLPVVGEARPPESAADGRLVKRVVLTTPVLDRQGDIVVPTGAKLRWFRKNPVVLWAHRFDMPPVGAVEADSIRVSEAGIEADVVFDAGSAAGREVFGLYDRGVMRGWSIGFVPLKWKVLEDGKTGKVRGYRVEEWELLELSAVPVPANPEALTRCLQEMEARPEDPRLAPVLNTLKAAAGLDGNGRSPSAERGDIAGRIMALERRIVALEAAESRQGTAADRPRLEAAKALAEAVAAALSARLPATLGALVQGEFDRRRGAV